MSGRAQALMRTRCPDCGTIFRVTSEQLRLKAGNVRCGQCQRVFNAFDQLVHEAVAPKGAGVALRDSGPAVVPEETVSSVHAVTVEVPSAAIDESIAPPVEQTPVALTESSPGAEVAPAETQAASLPEPVAEPALELSHAPEVPTEPQLDSPEIQPETPEASTLAAREAGLVAARELAETPGYNRWAAGTLAGKGFGGFYQEPSRHTVWPFVLVLVLLLFALTGQLLFYFRSEVVQRLPDLAGLFKLAEIDVPLPRKVDLVAIDSSDLQSDNARGLFVLQATLRNRASYVQAWPALELTLTDTSDTVVARRVMTAAEYLPPKISPESFPANGEVAVRLWIEAKEIGAAGYRLYVFYP